MRASHPVATQQLTNWRHLEGALNPELLFALAARNKVQLPQDDPAYSSIESLHARYSRFTCLDDFLQYYYFSSSVLLHDSDFEALAWDYFQHASSDGVMHAEVFFDPQAHLSRGISYQTIVNGFSSARKRAEAELGITSELICCFLRHLPVPDSLEAFSHAHLQASFGKEVVGIGLDSSEKDFHPELFRELYIQAKKQGLRLTAHAGEEGPASYIAAALNELGVERIDHGIRLVEDEDLLKLIADKGTMLTVCPLSNVVLRCVESISDVPIRRFLDAGVKFSINSDDPAYFGGYILENYCKVQEAHNLSAQEWVTICRNSIEGSWCSKERKSAMLQRLEGTTKAWQNQLDE
ncbi:MAG: adenine deaminase [Bogoriella megaspora]|nr:MAG: adenine deaminase [Bogoriella megaspora]